MSISQNRGVENFENSTNDGNGTAEVQLYESIILCLSFVVFSAVCRSFISYLFAKWVLVSGLMDKWRTAQNEVLRNFFHPTQFVDVSIGSQKIRLP